MNCSACGHTNRDQAKFCDRCGAHLALTCDACGTELRAEARFCDACGAPVSNDGLGDRAAEVRGAPPDTIVKAIQRDHSAMEGERRVVTVLFADAVGHTAISEQLDAEELYGLMQGCFERMQSAVHRYEGTVNQFTGDGILALFGAPIAHEDSARRAVDAALEMQRQLSAYAAEVKRRHPIQCSYRVGLNTGPVVVGRISDELDLEFAAVGDTVNLAARMESMAESGSVYITEHTYREVADYFEFETVGPLEVKGKSKPVMVYRPLRERGLRKRFDAASRRGLTRYVGRDEELGLLTGYLDRTRHGRGQVVLLTGDAGMGKSRLLLEFKNHAADDCARWLEGHCSAYGRMTAYLPFADILKRATAIAEGDSEPTIREKIDAATSHWSETQRKAVPFLKLLLHVDPESEALRDLEPVEKKAGTIDALRTFIMDLSSRERLVIVIEDLHWCDEQSMDVLTQLIDAVAHSRVLMIITSRPGHGLPAPERSHVSRLALSSLPADESAEMIGCVLDVPGMPDSLIELIASKAEGNPFYIEEITKALVESGALERRNGGYVLKRPVESIHVPNTIQEVILARMDRLDRDARGAMQVASVIGREFTVRLLDRIADVQSRLGELLHDLKTLELIYESGFAPELSYMFKHALTHDVAYSTLLVERRRAIHRTVALAIEELYADRLAEHYEALAHHFEEAQDWSKALDYLEKAGDKAREGYANQAALAFYSRAMDVCGRLGRDAYERAVRIAEKKLWIYFIVAQYDAGMQELDWIISMARRRRNAALEGRTLALKGFFATYAHQFEIGETATEEAMKLADALESEELRLIAQIVRFGIFKVLNRHAEAKIERARIESATVPITDPQAVGHYYYMSALDTAWRGQYADGLRQAQRWREQPVRPGRIFMFHLQWCESLLAAGLGHYSASIATLQTIEQECRRMGEVALRARVLNTLGWIYGILQNHGRAMDLNHEGIEVALMEGDEPEKLCNARLNCADLLIGQGQFDEAAKHLAVVEKTVRHPRPEDRWMLWRFSQHFFATSGRLRLAMGDAERAMGFADECLLLAEQSESAKYIVQARRLRGESLAQLKDTGAAQREFDAALGTAERLHNPAEMWTTYAAIGRHYRNNGNAAAAEQSFQLAGRIVGEISGTLSDEALRNAMLNSEAVRFVQPA